MAGGCRFAGIGLALADASGLPEPGRENAKSAANKLHPFPNPLMVFSSDLVSLSKVKF